MTDGTCNPDEPTGEREVIDTIMLRLISIIEARERSRADVHALLDGALDIRDHAGALNGVFRQNYAMRAALVIARHLIDDAFSWFGRHPTASDLDDWLRLGKDPFSEEAWTPACRAEIAFGLTFSPAVFCSPVREVVLKSLEILDDGTARTPALFRPAPKGGQGADPERARLNEALLLCWIQYEKGRGRRAGDAKQDVAAATGVTGDGIDSWKPVWVKRSGAAYVDKCLQTARALGRERKPFSTLVLCKDTTLFTPKELSMSELADEWKAAKAKSVREAKSRNSSDRSSR